MLNEVPGTVRYLELEGRFQSATYLNEASHKLPIKSKSTLFRQCSEIKIIHYLNKTQ